MLTLIKFLIFGHLHKWETIEVKNHYDRADVKKQGAMPTGQVHIQQCLKCGKVVRRNLY